MSEIVRADVISLIDELKSSVQCMSNANEWRWCDRDPPPKEEDVFVTYEGKLRIMRIDYIDDFIEVEYYWTDDSGVFIPLDKIEVWMPIHIKPFKPLRLPPLKKLEDE